MSNVIINLSGAFFLISGAISLFLINRAKGSLIKYNIRHDGLSFMSIVKTIYDNRKIIPDAWIQVVLSVKVIIVGITLAFVGLSIATIL